MQDNYSQTVQPKTQQTVVFVAGQGQNTTPVGFYVVRRLVAELSDVRIEIGRPDNVQWTEGSDGKLSVKSCYNILNSRHIPYGLIGEFDKALSKVWKMEVPTKTKAFGWRCFINRLPTSGALSKRGILPYSSSSCVFCCMCKDSGDHLLSLCRNVDLVCREIADWIGFENYQAEGIKESFLKWCHFGKKAKMRKGKEGR